MDVARQESIGTAAFAEQLKIGQELAAAGTTAGTADLADAEIQERIQEAEARGMMPALPAMTQQEDLGGSDDGLDDGKVDKISELYPDLNRKSYRQKDLFAEKHTMGERAGPQPFEMLEQKAEFIEAMEEGEGKTNSIYMMNAIVPLFQACREDKATRDWMASLFGGVKQYYDTKTRRAEIDEELTILAKLYNEQELEQEMKRLKDKQAARLAAVSAKGKAKADKQREKEDAKGESSSAKRQKK